MEPTTAPTKPTFSPAAQAEIKRLLTHYPADKSKSALLPILHIAQAEFGGWVSPEVQDLVAETLNIRPIEVYEVSSFYTQYNLKPVGKHVLEICRTGPCMLRGSDELTEHLERITGAKVGETSPDGNFPSPRRVSNFSHSTTEVSCMTSSASPLVGTIRRT